MLLGGIVADDQAGGYVLLMLSLVLPLFDLCGAWRVWLGCGCQMSGAVPVLAGLFHLEIRTSEKGRANVSSAQSR